MNIPNKLSSRHGRRIWLTLAIPGAIFSSTFGLAGTPSESAASLPSNTIVATIPVGSDPGSIAVSPNSQTVYVADYDAATVSVIDAASNTVTFTITVDATEIAAGCPGLEYDFAVEVCKPFAADVTETHRG